MCSFVERIYNCEYSILRLNKEVTNIWNPILFYWFNGSHSSNDNDSMRAHYCSNPTCKKAFDKPILIQYYACPYCQTKIEEEQKTGCQYWFGYLNRKHNSGQIPQDCIECIKVVECMLNHSSNFKAEVAEIKKWY